MKSFMIVGLSLKRTPRGSLEHVIYGGGVHPIILGNKLLCYPILMGS